MRGVPCLLTSFHAGMCFAGLVLTVCTTKGHVIETSIQLDTMQYPCGTFQLAQISGECGLPCV